MLRLIPAPAHTTMGDTRVSLRPLFTADGMLADAAQTLADYARRTHGITLTEGDGGITFTQDPSLPTEAYTLTVTEVGATVAVSDVLGAQNAEHTEAIHTVIRKKIIAAGVLGGLVAASTLFFWGVIPLMPEMDLTLSGGSAQTQNMVDTIVTTAYQILTEGYWFVDILFGGIWIFTLGSATSEITEQMEYSSMMSD